MAKLIMTAHMSYLHPSILISWCTQSLTCDGRWVISYKLEYLEGGTMFQRRRCSRKVANNCFSVSSCRRKPRLILTNVLETDQGKAYMERIKPHLSLGNRGQVSSTRRESGRCREEPLICRDTRSSQRESKNDKNKSVTPKCNQKTTSSPAQR